MVQVNRRPLLILLVVAAVAALCCCGGAVLLDRGVVCPPLADCDTDPASLLVRNERPGAVRIHVEQSAGPFDYPVAAGGSQSLGESVACRATSVAAYDENGGLIATLDPAGCETRTWVLGADGSARVLPGRVER